MMGENNSFVGRLTRIGEKRQVVHKLYDSIITLVKLVNLVMQMLTCVNDGIQCNPLLVDDVASNYCKDEQVVCSILTADDQCSMCVMMKGKTEGLS